MTTWNREMKELLRQEYPEGNLSELAMNLGVTMSALKTMAIRMSIRRRKSRSTWTEADSTTCGRITPT